MNPARKELILSVLRDEMGRQAPAGRLDLVALAEAIEAAISRSDTPPGAPDIDGKTPAELNASNDV